MPVAMKQRMAPAQSSPAKPLNITFRNLDNTNMKQKVQKVQSKTGSAWHSLQPRWRLLGRGQGVGAVPLQSHLGLDLWQARLQVGVQLLGQHLQGHCVLVVVGALLCFQLGRGRRLVAFLLERVPHLWQQDVDNLLLRWLDNDYVISSGKQLEFVLNHYFFGFFIGICVKNSILHFLEFPFYFWLKSLNFTSQHRGGQCQQDLLAIELNYPNPLIHWSIDWCYIYLRLSCCQWSLLKYL